MPERKAKPIKVRSKGEEQSYLKHRDRVNCAKSHIDNTPPNFQPSRLTRIDNLRDDARTFMLRTKENIELLVGLSRTLRSHGEVFPFRTTGKSINTSIGQNIQRLETLERANYELGMRILSTQSEVKSRNASKVSAQQRRFLLSQSFQIPNIILAKYTGLNLEMPENNVERFKLLRPLIYFDLELKGVRPLGRFEIELFTEAAPQVVLELVAICAKEKLDNILVKRLFPNLWLEVELKVASTSYTKKPLEYDMRVVNNGEYKNVLSFAKSFSKGFPDALIPFTIAFKPLAVSNGTRIGFGRVTKGNKIIDCLQPYGTKNGKMSKEVVFKGCGVV